MSPDLARLLGTLAAAPLAPAAPSAPPAAAAPPPPRRALAPEDVARAAAALGCDVAAVRAVAEVESSGSGFLADGRPTILYEAHVFHRVTGGRFASARDRCGVPLSVPEWDRSLYGAPGAHQWERMRDAERLHRDAAWKACSWGMFQILGENHAMCGFATVEGFVQAMERGAGGHLDAFVGYVKSKRIDDELRRKDWAGFAFGFNGSGYRANRYDAKMAAAFARHAATGAR